MTPENTSRVVHVYVNSYVALHTHKVLRQRCVAGEEGVFEVSPALQLFATAVKQQRHEAVVAGVNRWVLPRIIQP